MHRFSKLFTLKRHVGKNAWQTTASDFEYFSMQIKTFLNIHILIEYWSQNGFYVKFMIIDLYLSDKSPINPKGINQEKAGRERGTPEMKRKEGR